MQERISDAEFFDHLRKNGVPQAFHDKRLSLKTYGNRGIQLNEIVWEYENWARLTSQKKILNLYSTTQKGSEVCALLIRACLLLCRSAGFVSLRKLLAGESFESNLFENRTIIGIPRFEYAAGINLDQNIELGSQMMRFENMVYDHFDRGGFIIAGSSKPIAQLEGYRKNFLAHLKSVGQDVDLDQ